MEVTLRFRLAAMAALSWAWLAACSLDWDAFDPRLGGGVGAGGNGDAAGSGAAGGAVGAGGAGSVTTATTAGGSGGGGGPMAGDVVCHVASNGWFRGVAAHPDGGVVAGGDFWASYSFGGPTLVSAGEQDGVVVRLGPNCEHVFSSQIASPAPSGVEAVAVTPDGGAVVVGSFSLTADFGPFTATSNGALDIYVARLDPAGSFTWVQTFGGTGTDWGRTVAIDGSGHIYVGGRFESVITVGSDQHTAEGSDGIVIELDGAGTPQWSTPFGGSGGAHLRAIAATATGEVVVAGRHQSAMQVATLAVPHVGEKDVFVVALDGSGAPKWAHAFSSPELDAVEYAQGLALRPNGHVVTVGRFGTSLAFGATTLSTAGGRDIFLAELDADGVPLWARAFGGPGSGDRACAVAIDAAGNIGLAGSLDSLADLGGGPVGSTATPSLFGAVYDPSGNLIWSRELAALGSAFARGLAATFASNGDLVVVGYAGGAVDFGDGMPRRDPGLLVRLSH